MRGIFAHIKRKPGSWLISSLAVFQLFWLIHYHEYHNGSYPWPFVSDGLGYYSYLPAIFVYGDTDLSWEWVENKEMRKYSYPPFIQYLGPYKSEKTGKWVMKYPPGMAIIHAPMFLLAHALAESLGHEANGMTNPYRFGGGITAIFWMIIGMSFLWRSVRLWYSAPIAALTVITYYFGTNYFHYVLSEPGMTHMYNFAAMAAVLYYTAQWYRQGKLKHIIGLGIALGFVALFRPTNALVILVPILWGIERPREKLDFLLAHWRQLLAGMLACFLVMSPLLLYWKMWGGSWIHTAYGPEQFFWHQPMISEVLYGYHKGWIVYTPLMLLAIAGFIFIRKKAPESFWGLLIYLLVNVYVVSCWWSWWYGGSFGMRALVESSAVIAPCMAATFAWFARKKWLYSLLGIILLTGIALNILQTYQYKKFLIDRADMTKTVYWDVFLRTEIPEGERYKINKNLVEPDSMRYWYYERDDD
jgi:hypothetical protein